MEMVDNETLRKHGLSYHPIIGIFGCNTCDTLLPPPTSIKDPDRQLVLHLTNPPHNITKPQAQTLGKTIWTCCAAPERFILPYPDIVNEDYMEGLPHLAYQQGFICSVDGCCWCATGKTKGKPLPHKCPVGGDGKKDIKPCWFQSLNLGPGIGAYSFPVKEKPVPAVEHDSIAHRWDAISHHFPTSSTRHAHIDYRDLPPIVRHFDWDQRVEGLSESQLSMAGPLDRENGEGIGLGWSRLHAILEKMFHRINGKLPGEDGLGEKLVLAGSLRGADNGQS